MSDTSVSLKIDQAAWAHVFGSADGPVGMWLFGFANRVRSRAVTYCPVDTGRLRASITMTIEGRPPNEVAATVGADTEYARYVHDGTRYMAGRPFILDAMRDEAAAL